MVKANGRLHTVNQKMTVFVGGSIALALIILGSIAVVYTYRLANDRVKARAEQILQLNTQRIEQYFAGKANIVRAFTVDPRLHEFFTEYDEYRQPVFEDPDYIALIDYFDAIAADQDDVRSVFFADADSSDYFCTRNSEIISIAACWSTRRSPIRMSSSPTIPSRTE